MYKKKKNPNTINNTKGDLKQALFILLPFQSPVGAVFAHAGEGSLSSFPSVHHKLNWSPA